MTGLNNECGSMSEDSLSFAELLRLRVDDRPEGLEAYGDEVTMENAQDRRGGSPMSQMCEALTVEEEEGVVPSSFAMTTPSPQLLCRWQSARAQPPAAPCIVQIANLI